jgi:hypothetical protein
MAKLAIDRPAPAHPPAAGPPANHTGSPRPLAARRLAAATIPTLPAQPPQRNRAAARRFGTAVLCAGVAVLGAAAVYRLLETPARRVGGPQPTPQQKPEHIAAARYLNGGAALLAFSVLSDSALEHYRGAFHNPAMYLAPSVSAVTLANSLHMTATPEHYGAARTMLAGLALATGLGGFGFHAYNLAKREGGFSLLNLFYGAPLGAPWALTLAGLAGLGGSRLVRESEENRRGRLCGLAAGPLLAWGTAAGLLGTVAEAALLHYRGAFHDPFMFVPVTLPPVTAAALAMTAINPDYRRWAKPLLQATAAIGVVGAGFHAYGVSRNMGGFYNWSQNLLNGPPLPAPPSFTGVALAGLGALKLVDAR